MSQLACIVTRLRRTNDGWVSTKREVTIGVGHVVTLEVYERDASAGNVYEVALDNGAKVYIGERDALNLGTWMEGGV